MANEVAQDNNDFEGLFKNLMHIQKSNIAAFRVGQKDMLEKVLTIYKQKLKGLYSEEEFGKILKDYYCDIIIKEKN